MMRVERIRSLLVEGLSPDHLEITDDTNRHRRHAGFTGAGHFTVRIVAGAFRGRDRIGRHRLVNETLAEMFPDEIHALSIQALTPEEWADRREG